MDTQPKSPNQWEEIVSSIVTDPQKTAKNFQPLLNKRVLIACSGGADSVALAVLCKVFDIEFGLAYIDHGLNIETNKSELVVKDLSSVCDVPFFSQYLNMAQENLDQNNIEATARNLRYLSLEFLRKEHGYEIIATAHHLDDFAETYLINLIRGSGSGIASLVQQRNNVVRPLIDWRKKDLLDLVERCSLSYFQDAMNEDSRFVRNRIRNEAIDLLSDIANRDVTPLIARAATNIQKDVEYLKALAQEKWPKREPDTKSLLDLDPVLQVHALRSWVQGLPPSYDELERIFAVVRHEIKSTQISGNRTIWRSGAILYQDVTSQRLNVAKESK